IINTAKTLQETNILGNAEIYQVYPQRYQSLIQGLMAAKNKQLENRLEALKDKIEELGCRADVILIENAVSAAKKNLQKYTDEYNESLRKIEKLTKDINVINSDLSNLGKTKGGSPKRYSKVELLNKKLTEKTAELIMEKRKCAENAAGYEAAKVSLKSKQA